MIITGVILSEYGLLGTQEQIRETMRSVRTKARPQVPHAETWRHQHRHIMA